MPRGLGMQLRIRAQCAAARQQLPPFLVVAPHRGFRSLCVEFVGADLNAQLVGGHPFSGCCEVSNRFTPKPEPRSSAKKPGHDPGLTKSIRHRFYETVEALSRFRIRRDRLYNCLARAKLRWAL